MLKTAAAAASFPDHVANVPASSELASHDPFLENVSRFQGRAPSVASLRMRWSSASAALRSASCLVTASVASLASARAFSCSAAESVTSASAKESRVAAFFCASSAAAIASSVGGFSPPAALASRNVWAAFCLASKSLRLGSTSGGAFLARSWEVLTNLSASVRAVLSSVS